MMPHYLIDRTDGSVAIMIIDDADDFDPADEIAKWGAEAQAAVVGYEPIELSAIPQDRYFRNAWKRAGRSKVGIDMPKAREIHRNVLRRMREPLLARADVDYMRADEDGDVGAKGAVRARKQALRNVPQDPRIDAAKTPEQLRAIIPDVLKA